MSDAIPEAVRLREGHLELLDQRKLPDEVMYLPIRSLDEGIAAICDLVVRGAPAIGIAAGHVLAVAAARHAGLDGVSFLARLRGDAERLRIARPTAVNLGLAIDRVLVAAARDPRVETVRAEAIAIHEEDRRLCRGIAAAARPLLRDGIGVLTYCNAGALAASELGTATAPLYAAHADGVRFRVFACETRPVLQGARLTAFELGRAGIDVTLVCDGAAASLMADGAIDLALVGTDRVCANGDVVNKVGTLAVALAARHFGVPFYVACPSSTFDPATATGAEVTIEERSADEVTHVRGVRIAPKGVAARNPAFDVTPASLVTGIVTERGIARPPLAAALRAMLGSKP